MGPFKRRNLARLARLAAIGAVLCGCEADGTDALGPIATTPAEYHLVLLRTDTLFAQAGDTVTGLRVQVLGSNYQPAVGVRVRWQVLQGGGRIGSTTNLTDGSGIATVSWALGTNLASLQTLRLSTSERDSVLLYARARMPRVVTLDADTTLLTVDTVGAPVPTPLNFTVQLPDGRPVAGATVDYTVVRGGGRLSAQVTQTDSTGTAVVKWQLGDTAGAQEVAVSFRSDQGQLPGLHTFRALSVPGAPAQIVPAQDTIRLDALQDSVLPTVVVRDRAGNICMTPVTWSSLSPTVIAGNGDLGVSSVGNGSGQVIARSGAASVVIPVIVMQRPVRIRTVSSVVALHWVGAQAQLPAQVLDRRGFVIAAAAPGWQGLSNSVASVDSTGLVRGLSPGLAQVVAIYQQLSDTMAVQVDQVPASISVSPTVDTLDLDSVRTPTVLVQDSGGTRIRLPSLYVTQSDSSIMAVDPNGALRATLPGATTLTFRAGVVSTSIDRVVEGTAILVAGQRVTAPSILTGLPPFMITNGRVRISWSTSMGEQGSVAMEVRIGRSWYPASHPSYGDWLYITSSVITWPNEIAIIENTPGRVGLRMQYDDHWFLPQMEGFPASILPQPYPFKRTLWLAKEENGYYSWVDIVNDLHMYIVEHETGFGGLWGPATIRTNQLEIRTDTLSNTITYNGNPGAQVMQAAVDAAEFVRDNDPVRRLLVPLPEAPFITPVFPGWGYGSVYRYASASQSFGVYMYATAVGGGPSASQICGSAWANAPFPLRTLTATEIANCGPASP